MKNLILLCGKKQSGKTSAAAFIMAYTITQKSVVPNFNISPKGEFFFTYDDKRFDFDIESRDISFNNWMRDCVHPHVKNVAFADQLKSVAINLFGISEELVYGDNDAKNQPTHIMLDAIRPLMLPDTFARFENEDNRPITVREFLEVFGTDICRHIDPQCHITSAFTNLEQSNTHIGIITDGRFANEVYTSKEKAKELGVNLTIIQFGRDKFKSNAASETGLEELSKSDVGLYLDNNNMTLHEKNTALLDFLTDTNVLNKMDIKVSKAK